MEDFSRPQASSFSSIKIFQNIRQFRHIFAINESVFDPQGLKKSNKKRNGIAIKFGAMRSRQSWQINTSSNTNLDLGAQKIFRVNFLIMQILDNYNNYYIYLIFSQWVESVTLMSREKFEGEKKTRKKFSKLNFGFFHMDGPNVYLKI